MKLIELLNKIANGEIKEGTKIKVPFLNEKIFEYVYLDDDGLWAKYKGGESLFTFKCSELNTEVEIIEEKPQGRWKPEFNEKYWYIDYTGVCSDPWFNDEYDKACYLFKNIFKTKQDAEEYLEYKKALLEAEKPFEYGEFNFAIECDASAKKPYLGWSTRIMSQGQIYLGQDRDVAQAFVDKWEKQIMKYEFGIGE